MLPTRRQRVRPCRYKDRQPSGALVTTLVTYLRVQIPLQQNQGLQTADRNPQVRLHSQRQLKELFVRWIIPHDIRNAFLAVMHMFVINAQPTKGEDEINGAEESRVILRIRWHGGSSSERRWASMSGPQW